MYSTLIALLSAAFILPVTGNPIDKDKFLKFPRDAASYAAAALSEHNTLRAQHSAGAMSWDDNLASYAQELAISCVYGHDTTIGSGGYGQNIAAGTSGTPSPNGDQDAIVVDIINKWYSEGSQYTPYYGEQTPDAAAQDLFHFTQVVWKASTSLGCYSAYCPQMQNFDGLYDWYTVCNYSPAGNVEGHFADNVSPN